MKREAKIRFLEERITKLEATLSLNDTPETSTIASDGSAMARSVQTMLDDVTRRCDQLNRRIDLINTSVDSREARLENRLNLVEAELLELPTLIENGMRAVLRETADEH